MKKRVLAGFATVALAASAAQAAPVFQDNFNTPGALSGSMYSSLPATGGTVQFEAVADTVPYFGSGNTGMLKIMDTAATNVNVTTKLGQTLAAGWLSLSLYDAGSNASTSDWLRLTLKGPEFQVNFDDGKIGVTGASGSSVVYTVQTAQPIYIYFNSTSSSVVLNGVTVAAQKMVVYNGSTLVANSPNVLATGVSNVNFLTNSGDTNALFYMDDLAINNVPEPIGVSAMMVAGLGLLLRRRA